MAKYKIIPSSRTIVHSPISIGHKAEKGVEAIEFDLTAWVETYGSGALTVIMRRWGDAIPYPIALEIDENNKATWTLSDTDTAKAGIAYAQLSYIVGETVVKKSDIYTFRVMDSLTGEGEPPEAYESWLEHLTHLAAEAMAEVLDIEGIVTDKTLTVDGGIADGKATGDALALKTDKSTTYTKAEVDQMIEDVKVETDTTLEITGAPADAAETGRQIGLIKADLDAVAGATPLAMTAGWLEVNKSVGTVIDTTDITESVNYSHSITECTEGDEYLISGTGGDGPRLWCFLDSSKAIISVSSASLTAENLIITAPENSAYCIVQSNDKTKTSYKGVLLNVKVDGMKDNVDNLETLKDLSMVPITGFTVATNNRFLDYANGGNGTDNLAYITSYIDISAYKKLRYTNFATTANNNAGMCFYNASKTRVGGVRGLPNQAERGYVYTEVKIPTNAVYAKFTAYKDTEIYGDMVIEGAYPIISTIEGIAGNVDSVTSNVESITDAYLEESVVKASDFNVKTKGITYSYNSAEKSVMLTSSTSQANWQSLSTPANSLVGKLTAGKMYRMHYRADVLSGNPEIRMVVRKSDNTFASSPLILSDGEAGYLDFEATSEMSHVSVFITFNTVLEPCQIKYSEIYLCEIGGKTAVDLVARNSLKDTSAFKRTMLGMLSSLTYNVTGASSAMYKNLFSMLQSLKDSVSLTSLIEYTVSGVKQGACTDGKYIYQCSGDSSNYTYMSIIKYSIATGEIVSTTTFEGTPNFGHANDMTYDPVTGYLYICTMLQNGSVIRIDSKDMSYVDTLTLINGTGETYPVWQLAFDRVTRKLIVAVNTEYRIYDPDGVYISAVPLASPIEATAQGMETDGAYIYRATYNPNCIDVCDMDGERITTYELSISSEPETMMYDWMGTYYLTVNKSSEGGQFYLVDLME